MKTVGGSLQLLTRIWCGNCSLGKTYTLRRHSQQNLEIVETFHVNQGFNKWKIYALHSFLQVPEKIYENSAAAFSVLFFALSQMVFGRIRENKVEKRRGKKFFDILACCSFWPAKCWHFLDFFQFTLRMLRMATAVKRLRQNSTFLMLLSVFISQRRRPHFIFLQLPLLLPRLPFHRYWRSATPILGWLIPSVLYWNLERCW